MAWLEDCGRAVADAREALTGAFSDVAADFKEAGYDVVDETRDTWTDGADEVRLGIIGGGLVGGGLGFVGAAARVLAGTLGHVFALLCDVPGAVASGAVGIAGAVLGGALQIAITFFSGGLLAGLAREVGSWAVEGSRALGASIADAAHRLGNFVEHGLEAAAQLVSAACTKLRHALQAAPRAAPAHAPPRGIDRIEHIVVLALENRSFDHMFALAGIPDTDVARPGIDVNHTVDGRPVFFAPDAKLGLAVDPPHEFADVRQQLADDTMSGFVATFEVHDPQGREDPSEVMHGFTPERLPILQRLAREFAVCDHWYSSLPGPTLPNRQFLHAATSGGLADSPRKLYLAWAMTLGGFAYEHGTVFDELLARNLLWRVYAGDAFPLVKTLKNMAGYDAVSPGGQFRDLCELPSDLRDADENFPKYVFIEPDYGHWWSDFKHGNSQHPLDSVVGGEALIKGVYEALRASPVWERSMLVITYDEHGGFYDHRVPPRADAPGDARKYAKWAADEASRAFDFRQLGVRVPAVVVSPWVERGTVCHTTRDHSSIVATLAERFGLGRLTARGAWARDLGELFQRRAAPRGDTPVRLPGPFTG